MLTPAQIAEETRFWAGQDSEHNLFFSLGFEDPVLRSDAQRLRDAYEDARRRDDLGAIMALVPSSQDLKNRALAASRTHWTGWIWPLFLEHTRMEIQMFLVRISPEGTTPSGELCFGDRMNAEHCAFAAQLLDPTETTLQKALEEQGKIAASLVNTCGTQTYDTLLSLSQRSGAAIDRAFSGVDLAKTRSVIHPALATRVVREGKWFLGKMQGLPPG